MGDQNLPNQRQVKGTPEKSGSTPVSVRLRPAVTVTGLILLVGGMISVLSAGFGLFSTLAIGAGVAVLITNRLLIRSSQPLLDGANQVEANRELKLKELKRYISKAQYLEHVGDLGEKTAAQLNQISERFKKFQDLLALKFNPSEITYSRYFSAAEQTFLSILDNLHQAATSLNNISSMDPTYTDDQLKGNGSGDMVALKERKSLREKQVSIVTELLSFNEKAITEFDRVSTALSEVQTQRGQSDTGLETAMAELAELASRAKKYSIHHDQGRN